jgi:hypothetical protein
MKTCVYLKKKDATWLDEPEYLGSTEEIMGDNIPQPGYFVTFQNKKYYVEHTLLQKNLNSMHLELYVVEWKEEDEET